MQFWLIKSEPDAYGWDDLVHEYAKNNDTAGMWDGVRNHKAAKNMRAMEIGDQAFFYHSQKGLEIVGITEVTREHYPDPTDESGKFVAVNFRPVRKLNKPVTLKSIKANPKLTDMPLVRQSRLSVSQINPAEWEEILKMANE